MLHIVLAAAARAAAVTSHCRIVVARSLEPALRATHTRTCNPEPTRNQTPVSLSLSAASASLLCALRLGCFCALYFFFLPFFPPPFFFLFPCAAVAFLFLLVGLEGSSPNSLELFDVVF